MSAFIMLQRAIDDAYAKNVYGSASPSRSITQEERRQTELIVTTGSGSTEFFTDLASMLNSAVRNMTGKQTLTAILGVALIVGGVVVWKHNITTEAKKHELKLQVEMEELENERMNMIVGLTEKFSFLNSTLARFWRAHTNSNLWMIASMDIS